MDDIWRQLGVDTAEWPGDVVVGNIPIGTVPQSDSEPVGLSKGVIGDVRSIDSSR